MQCTLHVGPGATRTAFHVPSTTAQLRADARSRLDSCGTRGYQSVQRNRAAKLTARQALPAQTKASVFRASTECRSEDGSLNIVRFPLYCSYYACFIVLSVLPAFFKPAGQQFYYSALWLNLFKVCGIL
ncbi:MAG: hypothetical protein B0D91_12050 [Oceanospirillales bacterium LUC14_002_19_P2]|nr:MAG: hypothetical protein B0D91_12050 [Oceanospirillales bacterium LUC14_002_19_P2]